MFFCKTLTISPSEKIFPCYTDSKSSNVRAPFSATNCSKDDRILTIYTQRKIGSIQWIFFNLKRKLEENCAQNSVGFFKLQHKNSPPLFVEGENYRFLV